MPGAETCGKFLPACYYVAKQVSPWHKDWVTVNERVKFIFRISITTKAEVTMQNFNTLLASFTPLELKSSDSFQNN